MKIQIILTALIAAILMFAVAPMVMAEDNTTANTSEVTNDSVVPVLISANPTSDGSSDLNDNESASTFNMGLRQVGIWLTFNQERKAELELELAKLRLIQAKIAAKNNNTAAMQKALDAHQRIIDRVDSRIAEIESRNQSVEKLRGLERAIQVHEDRVAKLDEILANANLTDEQRAKVEDRLAHVENVTGHLNDLAEKRQEIRDQIEANRTAWEQQREAEKQARELAREANKTAQEQIRETVMRAREDNRSQVNLID